jgi:hypothetical protein
MPNTDNSPPTVSDIVFVYTTPYCHQHIVYDWSDSRNSNTAGARSSLPTPEMLQAEIGESEQQIRDAVNGVCDRLSLSEDSTGIEIVVFDEEVFSGSAANQIRALQETTKKVQKELLRRKLEYIRNFSRVDGLLRLVYVRHPYWSDFLVKKPFIFVAADQTANVGSLILEAGVDDVVASRVTPEAIQSRLSAMVHQRAIEQKRARREWYTRAA